MLKMQTSTLLWNLPSATQHHVAKTAYCHHQILTTEDAPGYANAENEVFSSFNGKNKEIIYLFFIFYIYAVVYDELMSVFLAMCVVLASAL